MLLFFDMKSGDTHNVIVFQRQLDGFMEINRAWSGRFGLLSLY